MNYSESEKQSICLAFAVERMRRHSDHPEFDKPGIELPHTFSDFVRDYDEAKRCIDDCIKHLPM